MENPTAMSAFVGIRRLLSAFWNQEAPGDPPSRSPLRRAKEGAARPGVFPENKNQDVENPRRDQFFLFTMSKSGLRQRRRIKNKYRTLIALCQGWKEGMSALPLKADLFQLWGLCPLMTQSGHNGCCSLSCDFQATLFNQFADEAKVSWTPTAILGPAIYKEGSHERR